PSLAPGQDVRYSGLAQQASLLGRIADRGLGGNVAIVAHCAKYVLFALPWVALALAARTRAPLARPRKIATLALAAAALAIALTLLASPKQGDRLYFAAIALACAAIASWVVPPLAPRWARTARPAVDRRLAGRLSVGRHDKAIDRLGRLELDLR